MRRLPPHDRIIRLRADAPPLPATGAACNGCGQCCAVEPCPLGILVSRRRRGRCRALRWDGASRRYRCGMIDQPCTVLRWLPSAWAGTVSRLAHRWISSASGCDADFSG